VVAVPVLARRPLGIGVQRVRATSPVATSPVAPAPALSPTTLPPPIGAGAQVRKNDAGAGDRPRAADSDAAATPPGAFTVSRAVHTGPVAAGPVAAGPFTARRGPTVRRARRVSEDPGQVAVAAGLADFAPDGSVVFAPPPSAASVQRQEAAPSPPPPADVTGPSAGVTSPPADALAPPAASPAGQAAPVDMAAMADQLYARIEQRLRHELMYEQERLGIA
jgi:hypothetical protein